MSKTNLLMKTLLLCLCMVGSVSVWAYEGASGDVSITTAKVNTNGKFTKLADGCYAFRSSSGYNYDSTNGLRTSSNASGVVFYLSESTNVTIDIVHTEAKNAHTVTASIYNLTEAEYQVLYNAANDQKTDYTFTTTSGNLNSTFTVEVSATSATFTGTKNLSAGYYALVPVGEQAKTFLKTVHFASASGPTITTQPTSGVYIKDNEVTLTVAATASAGSCSYEWFSCDDTDKTNENSLGTGSTSNTSYAYTFTDATDTKHYYFCRVTDSNGSKDSDVATVRIVPDAGKSTWDFSSITADDIMANTDFWVVKSNDATIYYNVNGYAKNERITLENKYTFDMVNGIKFYRSSAAVAAQKLTLFIGRGVNLQGNTGSHVEIPAEVGKCYRITYARGSANGTYGFSISSGATLLSGDLTTAFDSNSQRPTFTVQATATTIDLACTDDKSTISKVEEVELDPEVTSVSPDGGSVNGNTTVTISGIGTIYYQWSESSSATIGTGEWTASSTATVPNVGGTRYLHVYAANSTTNTEITTKTFTITKVGSVVVNSWDFTQELSSTDLDNIEADDTNWNEGVDQSPNGTRYTNKVAMSGTVQANGETLEVLDGIEMYYKTSDNIGAGNLRINSGAYVQINGGATYKILDLTEGDVVAVTYVSANTSESQDRSWSILSSNATLTSAEGTNTINGYVDNTAKTCEYTMTADGDMQLHQSNGLNVYSIVVTRTMPIVEVAVTTYGWATFNSDQALDLTNVDFAYKVTGVSGSAVTIEAVTETVEANTPLLIKGTTGSAVTLSIPIAASGSDISSTNKLIAVTADDTEVSKAAIGTNYVLAVQGGKAVFAPIDNTAATLNKGQAYLSLPEVVTARALFIDFEGETTGIGNIASTLSAGEGVYYNLNGQRISQPTHGLYIVNGRKMIVK